MFGKVKDGGAPRVKKGGYQGGGKGNPPKMPKGGSGESGHANKKRQS